MKKRWWLALIVFAFVGLAVALVIWLRPSHDLVLRAYYVGKHPITHLKIENSDIVDSQLERGQHIRCVLHPKREKGVDVSYQCQGKSVSFSFGYVGSGYCGEMILIFDEEGWILSDDDISPAYIW